MNIKLFLSLILLLHVGRCLLETTTDISLLNEEQNAEQQSSPKLAEADRLNAEVLKLYSEGKFDEALPLAKQVLEIRETLLSSSDVLIASAASNLAELYFAKGKYKEAEPLLLRAIEVNDKSLRSTDPILVKTLERYTCLLTRTDQLIKLKEFEKRRLSILETSAEPDRFWGALWGKTKAINMPRPEFPEAAKRDGSSGLILIEVILDEAGKVVKAEGMCGGNPLLVAASEEAARKARFNPILAGGKPVKVIGYVSYKFDITH